MPNMLAMTTTSTMEMATARPTSTPPSQIPAPQTARPMVVPRAAETSSSLPQSFNQSRVCTSPVARARTMSVDDWAPALPPLAMTRGRKNTRATTVSMAASNRAMAMPLKMFTTTRITSQPMRLR